MNGWSRATAERLEAQEHDREAEDRRAASHRAAGAFLVAQVERELHEPWRERSTRSEAHRRDRRPR